MERRISSGDAASEARRREAMAAIQLLEPAAHDRFTRIVRLAENLFDVPAVMINLVGADEQVSAAAVGHLPTALPLSESFCRHTVEGSEALVVTDASQDPRFRDNPLVTAPGGIRFYAGQPITAPNGARLGALCIVDRRRRDIDERQLRMLRELADFVEAELAVHAEVDRAAEVQRQLLPRHPPTLPGYTVAGACVPAAFVGGDFYDWYEVPGGFEFVLADVMGKGVPAGIVAAGVRSALRTSSRFNSLERAFNLVGVGLEPDLTEVGSFATVFAARLDLTAHTLTYIDAGHGIAGVVTAEGKAVRFESDGMPLGAPVGEPWRTGQVTLSPGDTFVCLSDGLLDLFGGIEEAQEAIRETVARCESADEVVQIVTRFGRENAASDDITALVVRRMPA